LGGVGKIISFLSANISKMLADTYC